MGCSHALYLHSDGTVWASGWNSWGQLGDGNSTSTATATQVAGLTDVIAVAAGCYHSVALKSDGTVWMWGQVQQGAPMSNPPDGTCPGFGGGAACYLHPAQWLAPSGIVQIAAGTLDETALASDGTVYTGGQIGNEHLTLPDPVTDIAMQDYATEAITTTGQVYSWGLSSSPAFVPGITGFATALGGGSLSGYAVTRDGAVWAWGDDRYGQLGDGKTTSESTAIKVPGLPPIVAVAAGFYHAVALDTSGGVWAWGDNVDGQVGPQQPQAVEAAPSEVPGVGNALAITAGGYSTIALTGPRCAGSQPVLTPALQHQDAGTDASVTVTYIDGCGNPVQGAAVAFSVGSGPDAGMTGTATTDASGQATFSYQGNATGTDTVGASVTGPAGTTSSNSVQVIWDHAISAQGGQAFTGTEPTVVSGTLATFTDPDPGAQAAEYAASIDWGDGGPASTGTISGPAGGPFTVTGSRTYSDQGSYTITVTITDTDNSANTATVTDTVTVTPPPCPADTQANFRWHYSANGSSGSWSGTKTASCPGSLTMGPQAMEGDLKVNPGTTIQAGYDLTIPGNNSTRTITVTDPQVTFTVHCVSGATPSEPTFTVTMPAATYTITGSAWYPSGDQSSPLVYQGTDTVPDLCAGGQLRLDKGGTFTATLS